ncbi:MAG: hypothetical protein LUJ25_06645 [Firmicutes bacterium]|nr:hypothetical protein [Bacillota bacterium]
MFTISSEREAFLFGQQQISAIPEEFHHAFLRGVRDKAQTRRPKFLDPEVEEAYEKLFSFYRTKTAIAKVVRLSESNLHRYVSGHLPVGPKVKERFLTAAASLTQTP